MSDQPAASAVRARHRGALARSCLVLAAGALALTVAACSSGTPTAAPPSPTQTARGGGANQPQGAFGTAAAVSKTSLEVQSRQEGQVTVKFTGSTAFTNTVKASLADVQAGMCVVAVAASGGAQPAKLTARTVQISAATAQGCAAGAFGGFGGGFAGRGGNASRTPDPSRRPRPSVANRPGGQFGRAFGKVTAVSSTGFTVQGVARGSNRATTTTVTVNASTTYTKTAVATSSALAVGVCIAALGPADDTGAVTARSIAVSKPDSTGCAGGLGGGTSGRGGFRGNGNGGGEGGAAPSVVPGGGNG
ncbi:MAG TPA: hypothetical protein VHV74_01425 [Pseudonocardiaceae bacterium]|jgi:hypothetical protein|nr:hypothetical protein [Pseudonocardiaceae bacterium]